ncbi:MAG: disulfide bond formation protein DsbA [Hyphomicrobiales bacterium]|nr:MAG: disulfide bond formation protein DsbA [Hyphomicrobiales bacterium]
MSYAQTARSLIISFLSLLFMALAPAIAQEPATPPAATGMEANTTNDGELFEGKADAPVTITEYSSFTCPHCASFHTDTYPELKKKYIDTGKVKMVFRPFPLEPMAAAASMLAKCAPPEQHFSFVHKLFSEQKNWAYSQSVVDSLMKIWTDAGFDRESFDKCLKNQKVLDGILSVKAKATQELDINSTPTFDINGEIVRGALPFKDFDKLIKSKLAKK